MATAIIYIRVSTDEQAQRGYSQRSQEEKLTRHCREKAIEIIQTIFEDHSAKNFDRPAWNTMMQFISSKTSRPNMILFTRWDRFSRNTANAYYMITQLAKLGIEPQAIDQPLDLLIPENKVLLAMYIVTAEVENDRRSLNVKYGIYRAKQEGKWMGLAPTGYINVSMPDGRKTIIPHEPEATLIKKAFEAFQESISIRQLYRISVENGLKYSLSAFYNMLQNPVYCGKIRIQQINDSHRIEVPGIHQPLISEDLFNFVQSRIKHRDKKHIKQHKNPELALRGLLFCPLCLKRLTGSGSKGNMRKYYYYHCYQRCNYRIRTNKINEHFLTGIGKLTPEKTYIKVFESMFRIAYNGSYEKRSIDKIDINKSLHKLIERVANARGLLVKGTIDEEDYLSIKQNSENRINILGQQLNHAFLLDVKQEKNFKKLLTYFSNLPFLFQELDTSAKAELASLLLKENLVYKTSDMTYNIKREVQIAYNLSSLKDQLENSQRSDLEISNLDRKQRALLEKIIKIENDKGNKISSQNAVKVLTFLSNLAKIILSIAN